MRVTDYNTKAGAATGKRFTYTYKAVDSITDKDSTSRTFSGLTKGKTYYMQVRDYKLDNGVRCYSVYCTTKTITIKRKMVTVLFTIRLQVCHMVGIQKRPEPLLFSDYT